MDPWEAQNHQSCHILDKETCLWKQHNESSQICECDQVIQDQASILILIEKANLWIVSPFQVFFTCSPHFCHMNERFGKFIENDFACSVDNLTFLALPCHTNPQKVSPFVLGCVTPEKILNVGCWFSPMTMRSMWEWKQVTEFKIRTMIQNTMT